MTSPLKNGVTLGVIAGICAGMIAATWVLTRDQIAANRIAELEASLVPALGSVVFDSDIASSRVTLDPPHDLPGNDAAAIYRVYNDGEAVAALFAVTARDGYSGPIRILLGVDVDGRVSGVRILEHRETPGLGDLIEPSKSDWVQQFAGRSLTDPAMDDWRIRRDGGVFDQLTGASVTPRAVLKAIRQTLVYFQDNRDTVFELEADGA